jgi:hypothetical protein
MRGDGVERHEAGVMPVAGIFGSRIAQPDNDLHGVSPQKLPPRNEKGGHRLMSGRPVRVIGAFAR